MAFDFKESINTNKTHAEQFFEKGYKLTEQRQAVLDVIIKSKGSHLSSEEIFKLIKQTHPEVGLATIYRTLPLLEEMGLISKIYLDDDCMRYEYCDPGKAPHHHLICLQCGSLSEEQADDLLGDLYKETYSKSSFRVTNHSVKLYGYCKNCSNAGVIPKENRHRSGAEVINRNAPAVTKDKKTENENKSHNQDIDNHYQQ